MAGLVQLLRGQTKDPGLSCFLLSFNVLPHGSKMTVAFPKVRKLYDTNQYRQSVFSHICLSECLMT